MLLIRATLCPVRRAANGANCTLLQGKGVNRLHMTSTDESRCLKVGSISFSSQLLLTNIRTHSTHDSVCPMKFFQQCFYFSLDIHFSNFKNNYYKKIEKPQV
jgi:hypothetical protein